MKKLDVLQDDEQDFRTCPHAKPLDEIRECPYNQEIGDGKAVCNCCGDCRFDCAMDI